MVVFSPAFLPRPEDHWAKLPLELLKQSTTSEPVCSLHVVAHNMLVITSTKEVLFSLALVCLFFCLFVVC